jgi:hypothetical protein
MSYHDAARPTDIHVIHQFEFANPGNMAILVDANMGSLTLTALDIGKVARLLSTGNFFVLKSVAPAVWAPLGGGSVFHTNKDKDLAALATALDGDQATSGALSATPAGGGYVQVFVNGKRVNVADGSATPGDCYFSNDGGTTPRPLASIAAGDTLHWVGSVGGYELETTDRVDLDYEET